MLIARIARVEISGPSRRDELRRQPRPERGVVLVVSRDAVGAALVGALVETLGYLVQFVIPPESVDDAMRRVRPSVAMVDCEDPAALTTEVIGRARMRGISVLLFGSREVTRQMRELAEHFGLHSIIMPASAQHLEEELLKSRG